MNGGAALAAQDRVENSSQTITQMYGDGRAETRQSEDRSSRQTIFQQSSSTATLLQSAIQNSKQSIKQVSGAAANATQLRSMAII